MPDSPDNPRSVPHAGGLTRGALLRRTALAAGAIAVPAVTIATFDSSTGTDTATAQGAGTGGSFPGGTAYDREIRKVVNGRTLKIGFTPPVLSEFFDEMAHACWQQMANYEERFGVRWHWARTAPKGNFDAVQEHFDIVQNWVTAGYDAILICTGGEFTAMQRIYAQAQKSGTQIFQFNMPMELWDLDTVETTGNIGYDNALQSGYLAGQYIAEKLNGKGTILQIWGPSGSTWSESRQNGLDLVLREYPDLKVVGKADGGYLRDKGLQAAQNLLERNPDVNAIYGENEEMALGASQAIDARGLKHWDGKDGILTIGADGLRSGFQAIRNGRLTATVDVNAVDQGLACIQAVFASLVLGKSIDRVTNVPTQVVDKTNVDPADAYIAWALGAKTY